MDVANLIAKQLKASEALADALAVAVERNDDTGTIRDLANATACSIDKLATLASIPKID